MITDEMLERLLEETAASFEVPAHGARDIVSHAREEQVTKRTWLPSVRRPSRRAVRRTSFALAGVALVAGAIGLVRQGGGGNGTATSSAGGAMSAKSGSGVVPSPAGAPDRVNALAGKSVAGSAGGPAALFGAARPPATAGRSATGVPSSGVQPLKAPSGDSARVVKTGSIDLEVGKGQVPHTLDRLTALATTEQGYVATSHSDTGGNTPSGSVTLRVPVDAFEHAVNTVDGFGKVLDETTSGKDVTAQYVDLGARIKALQSTRATFLTLLSKANTIGDTLAVQQQIQGVQTQIEQLQGQQKLLGDQSDLSTLTVTVTQKGAVAVAPPKPPSGLHRAFDKAVHGFVTGLESIIAALGPLLLVLLVLVALLLAGRFGYRQLRRRLV